ncbi:lasso peptide biosynthesis B2 protein [Paraburkholderia sp. CNPSo 3281]|uniref:lasso peptide biosynthesis B2 protein n=1 Tax=Paraburkholderia sp. CNPSo 3281 TaxID=2940933 RepID=UPI0020B67E02|nr:lasso peptide biosynthesis B2 protein [Paraburkholderia sp. CNPSo 3281]MCP3717877.1 lasso peptide biosynthesis B2 protein [Paraburkholderia sp. CNPSo 3281]
MKISDNCYVAVFDKIVIALDIRRTKYFLYDGKFSALISSIFIDGESQENDQLIDQLVFDEVISLSGRTGKNSNVSDFRGIRFCRFDAGRWSSRNLSCSPGEKLSVQALIRLAASAFLLRLSGANCIRRLRPIAMPCTTGIAQAISSRTADRYHKAALWCPLKITCIQMSLAIARDLRKHGCPAQIVIGVRPHPFVAHAWVEVGGHIYGDEQDLNSCYAVIYKSPI